MPTPSRSPQNTVKILITGMGRGWGRIHREFRNKCLQSTHGRQLFNSILENFLVFFDGCSNTVGKILTTICDHIPDVKEKDYFIAG